MTCPSCQVEAVHAWLSVKDFRILETDVLRDDRPTQQNLRYIRAALAVQRWQVTTDRHPLSGPQPSLFPPTSFASLPPRA